MKKLMGLLLIFTVVLVSPDLFSADGGGKKGKRGFGPKRGGSSYGKRKPGKRKTRSRKARARRGKRKRDRL